MMSVTAPIIDATSTVFHQLNGRAWITSTHSALDSPQTGCPHAHSPYCYFASLFLGPEHNPNT